MTTKWQLDAECRQYDPDMFFPEPSDKAGVAEALSVCKVCPVLEQCLQDVMEVEASLGPSGRHGIRGGETPSTRAAIYRRTRPARLYGTPVEGCGDAAGYQRHRRARTQPCQGCSEAEAARWKAVKAAKAEQELAA